MMWLWGIPAVMMTFAGLVMWAAARSCSRYDRLLDHIEIEAEDHIGPKRKGEAQGAVHMYTPRRGRHLGIYTDSEKADEAFFKGEQWAGDEANGRRQAAKGKP